MAEAMEDSDSESADEEEAVPWAQQTPTTRITGEVTELIYAGNLGSTVEQNDTSFGVRIQNPSVEIGTLFTNSEKPSDGTTEDAVDDETPRPTDYRIADADDENVTIANGALVSGEDGPNTYDEADGFDEDEIIVWYNGLSGGRVGRVLDFNGQPFARYTDDGYLIHGLLQAAEGWRSANGEKRSKMAQNGKAPRVVRAPLLRDLAGPIAIDITRNGRSYRAHVFDAEALDDEHGLDTPSDELPTGQYGLDVDAEIEWAYDEDNAVDRLEDAGIEMAMYHGDGWQDEPSEVDGALDSGTGEFSVESSGTPETNEDGFTEKQEKFIDMVVDELTADDTQGLSPSDAFDGGLDGLIQRNIEGFDVVPNADDVERAVYERVSHLDVESLED